jgi:hypothetical protein
MSGLLDLYDDEVSGDVPCWHGRGDGDVRGAEGHQEGAEKRSKFFAGVQGLVSCG